MSDPIPWRSIGIMAVAMSFIPAGDAMAKFLMRDHGVDPIFIAWARFGMGFLMVLPFLNRRNFAWAGALDWRVLLRGVLIAATVSSILNAVMRIDLATAFGAFFIAPIFSYALSTLLLGERIRRAQTALLVIGFIGVMLVVKPGFGMNAGIAFAVLAGLIYGAFLTTGRWLSGVAPPMTLVVTQLLIATLVLTPFGLPAMPPIAGSMWVFLILSALFSVLGNLLLLFAYREVEATRLAPFVYFQLVAATMLGLVLFGDLPDLLALLGLALLLLSGFASLALKRRA